MDVDERDTLQAVCDKAQYGNDTQSKSNQHFDLRILEYLEYLWTLTKSIIV